MCDEGIQPNCSLDSCRKVAFRRCFKFSQSCYTEMQTLIRTQGSNVFWVTAEMLSSVVVRIEDVLRVFQTEAVRTESVSQTPLFSRRLSYQGSA